MVKKIAINGDNGSNSLQGGDADEVIYGFTAHAQDASIVATKIASGFGYPGLALALVAPPDDPDHLFVVQRQGVVKVVDVTTGQTLEPPFLDLSSETIPTTGEQGMLGFAFDPDYASNGHVYVYTSTVSGDVEIRRYTTAADDPFAIDPNSKHIVKTINFPEGTNKHRSGWMDFGPDGYLYVTVGDAEDGANAQRIDNPFGKVLRLDVRGDDHPEDSERNYAVPTDNPATIAGILGDSSDTGIFAAGFRNPWKGGFDRATGELYISDVGSNKFEEVNLVESGANYGWSRTEGYFDPSRFPDYTNPIHAYDRSTGTTIVGGYVYRGQEDAFHGHYFFGDMNKSRVWVMGPDGEPRLVTDITADIEDDYGRVRNPIVFGEDALGNVYMATSGGDIVKLTPQTTSGDQADMLSGGGGSDAIYAGAGDDTLLGGSGNDMLHGMAGDDSMDGGTGRDRMTGGRGDDVYVVDDAKDTVLEKTGEGTDTIRTKVSYALRDTQSVEILWTTNTSGTAAIDLTGNKLDNRVSGNAGSNTLSGRGGDDLIKGLGGDDVIKGDSGRDDLQGGAGNDRIEGGSDADELEGGAGLDRLSGGSGADMFIWRSTSETSPTADAADIVMDFDRSQGDRLSLLNIDAREDRDGPQAFTFIGTAAFSRAGQVRYAVDGEQTLVYLNTDTDSEAEGVIRLAGIHEMKADWIVL